MAFKKGEPRPANAGRKKGTPNKKTTEIAQFCRSILEDPVYRRNLLQRAREGTLGHLEAVMYHYAYGKPLERIDVSHEFRPLVIDRVDSRGDLEDALRDQLADTAIH